METRVPPEAGGDEHEHPGGYSTARLEHSVGTGIMGLSWP